MKRLYHCKVCGYVVNRTVSPEICPACGFKGKIFEEYDSPLSKKRRMALDVHVHPIMVHIPIAFAALAFLVSFLIFIGFLQQTSIFSNMLRAMIYALPVFTISAAAAGIFDGKMRFKKLSTPLLKKKIGFAVMFFVISVLWAVIQFRVYPEEAFDTSLYLILSAVLLSVAGVLGLIGGRMIESKVRG